MDTSPQYSKESYKIYRKTGNGFWTKTITKDMANLRISFEDLDVVKPNETRKLKVRPGYDHFNAHIIFYIKMKGNFKINA